MANNALIGDPVLAEFENTHYFDVEWIASFKSNVMRGELLTEHGILLTSSKEDREFAIMSLANRVPAP